jgi:divalent metal cation (Fe/Co/Zn/Cd) transporter
VDAGALVARERLQRRGVRLEWFTVGWNVAEALVAIVAGVAAGSIALIGFGVDSGIEVVAASALLWRFRQAKADASEDEHSQAERRALYIVSATFFALAAYIAFEAIQGVASREEPDASPVGLILSVVSLAVVGPVSVGRLSCPILFTVESIPCPKATFTASSSSSCFTSRRSLPQAI